MELHRRLGISEAAFVRTGNERASGDSVGWWIVGMLCLMYMIYWVATH
jgi:hypothetical protein